MMKTAVEMLRPWGVIITSLLVAAVQIGGSSQFPGWGHILASCFAIGSIVVGAYSMNDFADRDIDALVHPQRVIPSGRLSPWTVLGVAVLAFAIGAFVLALQGIVSLVFGAILIALQVAYSPLKKLHGVFGNVTVALLLTLVVAYAYSTVKSITGEPSFMLLASTVFFAMLSQEVVKDVEDMDTEIGFRTTLPIQIGVRPSFQFAAGLLAIALLLSVLFLFADRRYVALAIAVPVIAFGGLTVATLLGAKPKEATKIVRMMKIAMSVLVVVLVAVRV
jgi:4-hydroxybenzoate polyprenyltransferase